MTDDASGSGRAPAVAAQAAVDQSFDGESLYAVRATVAAHASAAGIPERRIRDVVLAVHELAANAVRHGAGQGRIRLWITGDGIRCEVTDPGSVTAPALVTDVGGSDTDSGGSVPWPVEHGHGLWLVRQIADQASLDAGPSGTVAVVDFRTGPTRA